MKRLAIASSSLVLVVGAACLGRPAALAQDDRVAAMCEMTAEVDPGQGESCECALNAVKADASEDDFDTYTDVGMLYLENMADGLERADAWDAAAIAVGEERGLSLVEVLEITNPIGQRHRRAIQECAG